MVYTYTINIALNYKYIPRTEIARTNYLTSSLSIFVDKTLVSSSIIPFTYPSIDRGS